MAKKNNTPRKIAFRQTNLIKIIIGKFIDKTRNLNLKSYIPWFVKFRKSSWRNMINWQWYKISHRYNFWLEVHSFYLLFVYMHYLALKRVWGRLSCSDHAICLIDSCLKIKWKDYHMSVPACFIENLIFKAI